MLTIREATSAEDLSAVRELFLEYANWLGIDLCFQGFEHELATLPADYVPEKRGALFIAELDGDAVGCAGLHACFGESHTSHIAEIKRAFVRPEARGKKIGRALVSTAMTRARELGYTHMRLDTLPNRMTEAVDLYKKMGFYDIEAYRPNPMEDVAYMEAAL
ncbi:MAG: GNAT family N-acetyltransferase [Acidobacteriaceae bacterium]